MLSVTHKVFIHWVKWREREIGKEWVVLNPGADVTALFLWQIWTLKISLPPCPLLEAKRFQAGWSKSMAYLEHCHWQMDYRKHWCLLMLFQLCLGTVWSCGLDLGRLHVYWVQRSICSCRDSKYSSMQHRKWVKREQLQVLTDVRRFDKPSVEIKGPKSPLAVSWGGRVMLARHPEMTVNGAIHYEEFPPNWN